MFKTKWEELPEVLSVKEVSNIMRYGPARVRELCNAGLMPNVRFGRAFRIPKEALQHWLLQQSQKK